MKLGMPALIEYDCFARNVELCRKLSLDFIEINMNLPYCDLNKITAFVQNNEEMMDGIGITIHLPEEIDIASFHKTIRSGFLKFIKETIDISRELRASVLNLHAHPGIYFTLPGGKVWVNEKNGGEFIKIFADSLAELNGYAKNSVCKICFENIGINKYALDCFQEIKKYDSLYYTWDIGHDASSGYQVSDFMMNNISRVAHMHLHDFDGKKDHNPLYSGNVDINKYIGLASSAPRDMSVVIEVKTEDSLTESVNKIRARGVF